LKENNEKIRDTVIARLIANTRRKKRPDNLNKIADDILWLSTNEGSLQKVSQIIGISTEMLKKFLSVKQLSFEMRKLVEERKIDSVTIVHLMKNFNSEDQKIIANEVMSARLTADDMKVLVPLKRSLPNLNINQLISRVQDSKDRKLYIIRFEVPSTLKEDFNLLENRFKEILSDKDIASFTVEDKIGNLELTSEGLKQLKETAKKQNLSLRKFVSGLVQH